MNLFLLERRCFAPKTIFQLFVGRCMSYLRHFCLFGYRGVQHMLCCVFWIFIRLRLVYPMLPVSLDSPFLIAFRYYLTSMPSMIRNKTGKTSPYIHNAHILKCQSKFIWLEKLTPHDTYTGRNIQPKPISKKTACIG